MTFLLRTSFLRSSVVRIGKIFFAVVTVCSIFLWNTNRSHDTFVQRPIQEQHSTNKNDLHLNYPEVGNKKVQISEYLFSADSDSSIKPIDGEQFMDTSKQRFLNHDKLLLDKSCNYTEEPSILTEQNRRLGVLHNACKRLPIVWKDDFILDNLHHIIVDEHHRTVYCSIPKVGCTHWKRALLTMATNATYVSKMSVTHDDHIYRANGLKFLDDYSPDNISKILKTYFKFMFVRNPIERIVSAYRDKFVLKNHFTKHFQRKYGRSIIKMFRQNPSKESLRSGGDVEFPEFVKYLIHLSKTGGTFNPHWRSFHSICQPCLINYDFIGKIDTIGKDSSYVLGKMASLDKDGAHCPVELSGAYSSHEHSSQVVDEFLKSLSTDEYKGLLEVFSADHELFNYTKTSV